MDYKEAYEKLNEAVREGEDTGLQFTAINIANDLVEAQQEQRQQQEEKKREEQPSRAEKLAKERNERTPKTNLWG